MFGTELRLTETLRTGKDKDHYRHVEVTVSVSVSQSMSRYYLSPQLYPHEKLPTYLNGVYIFSGSLLSLLYSCALR